MEQLKQLKTELGLTWKQLGAILGKSESTVAAWASGKSIPKNLTEDEIVETIKAATNQDVKEDATEVKDELAQVNPLIVWNLVYAAVLKAGGDFAKLDIRRIRFNNIEKYPYTEIEIEYVKEVTGVDIFKLLKEFH